MSEYMVLIGYQFLLYSPGLAVSSTPFSAPTHNHHTNNARPFLSTTYRCPKTLLNLFQSASHTERITVGVINYVHTETDDLNCLKEYCRLTGKPLETGNCPHAGQIQQTEVQVSVDMSIS